MENIALRLLVIMALLISGCSTTNQYELASYEKVVESRLPEVSVFYKKPSEDFFNKCKEHTSQSINEYCDINQFDLGAVQYELLASELFENVRLADDNSDFRLLITSATYNLNTAEDGASAALAGATLMMTPISISQSIELEVVVMWRGIDVDRFELEVPFTRKISVFSISQDTDQDIARTITSHIIKTLQEHDSFSPLLISERLDSTNYKTSLHVPETVDSYYKDLMHIYHHPFQGTQVRYVHEQFDFDYFDVFVYPIRQTSWEDREKALDKEAIIYRNEFEIFKKEQGISEYSLGENEFHNWTIGDDDVAVLNIKGRFTDNENAHYVSEFYLFIRKDKFVKIRTTYSEEAATQPHTRQFVRAIMQEIKVPDESLFMAKLRQEWRLNSAN